MSKTWYPIITEETCTECGKCIAFCKHDVYDKENGNTPVVINPESCINHCHGCGGLCPTGSITYAGEDTGWTPPNRKVNESEECSCGDDCSCNEEPVNSCCPGTDTSCGCSSKPQAKELTIDFLYLDLSICERCIATGETLDEALRVLDPVLKTLNYAVTVNNVNITTEKLAEKYRFVSSPTIRVNGIDICNELVENECENCCDLAGSSVDCRVFVYEGKEYTQPPAAAIADGVLRVLYGNIPKPENDNYVLPENIKKYFIGRASVMNQLKMFIYEPALCCETGVCGADVDPELLRISSVANNLKKNGITLQRYNLNNAPQAFIDNAEINNLINSEGVDALPATVVDSKIVKTKAYPTNGEIVMWLNISADYLVAEFVNSGGCCCDNSECC